MTVVTRVFSSPNLLFCLLAGLLVSLGIVNIIFRFLSVHTRWRNYELVFTRDEDFRTSYERLVLASRQHSQDVCGMAERVDTVARPDAKTELSKDEYDRLIALMAVVADSLTRANVPFFMYSGTLLGSYFFHDVIPWDDDIDVLVPISRADDVIRSISHFPDLAVEYVLVKPGNTPVDGAASGTHFLRAYYQRTASERLTPRLHNGFWTFPFVDLGLYSDNGTHAWDSMTPDSPDRIWPLSHIFPTHLRPLGKLWLPSPHQPHQFLTRLFRNKFICLAGSWDHRLAQARSVRGGGSCVDTLRTVPVVRRRVTNQDEEELVLSREGENEILYKCKLPQQPECCTELLSFH